MQTLTSFQLMQVNDVLSNSREFYTDHELFEMFTNDFWLDEVTAKKALTFLPDFQTNPFFCLVTNGNGKLKGTNLMNNPH